MYSVNDLPKKCYACSSCQKFTPKVNQANICAICEHVEGQHEQVYFICISYDLKSGAINFNKKKFFLTVR